MSTIEYQLHKGVELRKLRVEQIRELREVSTPPEVGHTDILTRELARDVVKKYGDAWVRKDPSSIVRLFTRDAVYHEQVLSRPVRGRKNIARYWHNRVARGQDNIIFRILNVYVDGTTVVAEWEAQFDVIARAERLLMRQVAILEFKGTRISSLREYWSSKTISKKYGMPARRHR